MNFQDRLTQELNRATTFSNDEEVEYPSSKLKHEQLFFSDDRNELMVRILPDIDEDHFFAEGFQEFWINTRNKNGKEVSMNVTLPLNLDPDSEIVQKITQWQAEGRVPNRYGNGPSKRFVMNVVQVARGADNQLVHETDEHGNLVVRMLTIPQSAYASIIKHLQDINLAPANGDPFSFIGEQEAYPVHISRGKGSNGFTQYSTQVYPNMPLGPLPSNWRELAEDLKYQTTPSEEYNKNWLDYVIAVVDGKEEEFNANRNSGNGAGAQGATTNTFANNGANPNPFAGNPEFGAPVNNGGNSFGGAQPNFGFEAPTPNAEPTLPDNAMNNAPIPPTTPATPNPQFGGTQPSFGGSPQGTGASSTPAQEAPATPVAPPTSPVNTDLPNVDDMIAEITKNVNQ